MDEIEIIKRTIISVIYDDIGYDSNNDKIDVLKKHFKDLEMAEWRKDSENNEPLSD